MAFDFSALFWIFLAIMVLQPLFTGRWYALRRAQAIRAIERLHGSRVITMIHRQEKRSIFGFAVSRHIDLEGARWSCARGDADRPRSGSTQGQSNRLCSCLCHVR